MWCCSVNTVPSSFTSTVCSPIVYRTSRFVDRSWRSFLASPARPLQRPARWPNVAGILVRSWLLHLSGLFRHLRHHSDLRIARRTMPLRPGSLRKPRPQSRRCPKPLPMFPLLTTMPRWRLQLTCRLRAVCRVRPWSSTSSCPVAGWWVCYSGLSVSAGISHIDPSLRVALDSDDATPDHAPLTRKAASASATVTSAVPLTGLSCSICRRSSSRWIVFGRISMWILRTFTPCLTHHRYQMVIYLWYHRPRLRNRSRLTRRVMPSLSIAPVSVRRRRRQCPSLTALRSCSSCRRRRLLFRRRSRLKPIPPCCSDSSQLITSGFLSLRRILCPSHLHLYSARGLLMRRPAPQPWLSTLWLRISGTAVPTDLPHIGTTNTRLWTPHLVCRFTIHNSWSGWGRQSLPACSVGHLQSGSG